MDQWIHAIETLGNGETIYLPYDFSDEYIACIRVKNNGEALSLLAGYTDIPGYSVWPSQINQFVRNVRDFRLLSNDLKELSFSSSEIIGEIQSSKAAL